MNKKSINIILASINFISILFILQIELNIFPLFLSAFNSELFMRIKSLISNVSQGIVVSTIFYLVVIFIPEYSKSRTIRKLITPRLITITNMIQVSVEYLCYKYNLPSPSTSLKNHELKDFKKISMLSNQLMKFKYKVKTQGTWSNYSTGKIRELDHFSHEKEIVQIKIDEILSLPIIQYEEDELIECLANLRDTWFYAGVEALKEHGEQIIVSDFDKGVFDYYKYYKILNKYITPSGFEVRQNETQTHTNALKWDSAKTQRP